MTISLTSDQERFVQSKLRLGHYGSAEEILEIALRLLDEYERSDAEWAREVQEKVDAAIEASTHTKAVDGETFVTDVLDRLRQVKQT